MTLLRESDPHWVYRIGRGAHWMFLSQILSFCASSLADAVPQAAPVFRLLVDVAWFAGVWMLTAPEPGRSPDGISRRRITRAVAVLGIACDGVLAVLRFVQEPDSLPLYGMSFMVSSLQMLCVAFYLADLAARIPDPQLARQSRIVTLGIAVIYAALAAFALTVDSADVARESVSENSAMLAVACPFLLVALVLTFWFLWVLHRFQKAATGFARMNGVTADRSKHPAAGNGHEE